MEMDFLMIAAGCLALSGVPGLVLGRRGMLGRWIAVGMNVIGSCIGGFGLILQFKNGGMSQLTFAWSLPIGSFSIGMDDLGVIFLLPILLISALGSIYGLGYWRQSRHPGNGQRLRFCWGIMTAAMMLVVLARDGVLFLMAWEIMGLAAFFLFDTEDKKPEVRRAAWIYLIAAHFGTACLFATFGFLRLASGSFDLWPQAAPDLPTWITTTIFITGIVGFGVKAGIMPLHVWLPGAHANAPSHVSAMMSGVLLNLGIYGIIRIGSFLPQPPIWWGATLLVAGTVSGVLGVAFAIAQQDFKRLLAYSSIENMGIITIGVGLALLGRSFDRFDWIVLGLGGALLHIFNHSLFKPLLFMGAGNILYGTRTRKIDLLGGLAKTMPRTFRWVLIGAIAICGLPPLNGFVSELLIYIGLFRTVGADVGRSCIWAALAAPALAIIGALAIGTFVKLIGVAFGGLPRTGRAEHAHDPSASMIAPIALLGICCVFIGVVPETIVPMIERAVAVWDFRAVSIESLVPLYWFTGVSVALVAVGMGGFLAFRWHRQRMPVATAGTWDCGYARPRASMQYTGSSFAQSISGLFVWAIVPRKAIAGLSGLFPGRSRFRSETPDPVLDDALIPAFSRSERVFSWARPIQRGPVQVYVLYLLSALLLLLLFAGWTG